VAANESRLASAGRAGRYPSAYEPVRRDLLRVADSIGRHVSSADESVGSVMKHIVASRGGMIRPALLLLSGKCLGRIGAAHIRLGAAVEMMHTATLLHDDVIDEAHVRRGRASINSLWGNDCAVLAGDYLLARTLSISAELQDVRMSRTLADTAQTMCRGELRQDLLRGRWDISEIAYHAIIEDKTAAFFGACCSLGAIASGASRADTSRLAAFGLELGLAFQHTDDLLDIVGRRRATRKSSGSDLANGKMTLAFIRMLAALNVRTRAAVIRKLESPPSDISDFVGQLRRTGSLRYVYDVAAGHVDSAVCRLGPLRDCPARRSLEEIARSVTSRIDIAALAE
jgi:octaprenyl-diphosphate synthase